MALSSVPRNETTGGGKPMPHPTENPGGKPGGKDDATKSLLAAHDKKLFKGLAISLGLHLVGLALVFICAWMASYARNNYRYWDSFEFMDTQRMIIRGSIYAVPYTIANMIILKRWGKPIPASLNILYFSLIAVVSFITVAYHAGTRLFEPARHCDEALHMHEGVYESCLAWAPWYEATVWFLFVDLAAFATTQVVLLFVSIDDLTRRRPGFVEPDTKWTFPVGQVSIELALRWGYPQAQKSEQTQPSTRN